MSGLRQQDWHAIVAIAAAAAALLLHLFHVIDEGVVLAIILVVLALLLFDNIRHASWQERIDRSIGEIAGGVADLRARSRPPDAILVGPRHLREASVDFAARARGEMTWFNVCLLMFRPQALFDALLRPAVENPAVTAIQFVLDEREQERWRADVLPKLEACAGRAKVLEPHWSRLDESVSFILSESSRSGAVEAHLSFWGEPFMARSSGGDVPRYIFHVQPGSELLPQLIELDRRYRFGRAGRGEV
jgi:hypothetical protein